MKNTNVASFPNEGIEVERIDTYLLKITQMASGKSLTLSLDQMRAITGTSYKMRVVLGGFSRAAQDAP